jgi:ABC-type nitrate/sulfonate/bicarbonate transport system permease component
MNRRFNLPGLVFLIGLAAVWQIAAIGAQKPSFPSLTAVAAALAANRAALFAELGHTLLRAGAGFAIALATRLPLGILLGRVRPLGRIFEPVVELFRPLPPIAVIPVSMIFLGIGDTAKIAVVAYGASFPILINAIDAVRAIDPMLSHVARSLRLLRMERMRLIDLPAALPRIAAGIRLSVAVSLLLAVVSEMLLSTDGLGAFLMRSQESFQIAEAVATLLLIALVALVINLGTQAVERRVLAWHHARTGGH